MALLATLVLSHCSRCEPDVTQPQPVSEAERPAPPEKRAVDDGFGLGEAQLSAPAIRVGDDVATVGYLLRTLGPELRRWARVNGEKSAREKLAEALERATDVMLLWPDAEAAGYADDPAIVAQRQNALVDALRAAVLAEAGDTYRKVSDADRAAFHAAHADEYTRHEAIRAQHIVLEDEPAAQALLERLLSAEDPNTVFAEHGIRNVRPLGLIPVDPALPVEPPIGRHQAVSVPPELRSAVMELKIDGEILPRVVQSPQGLHIIRRVGTRPRYVTPPEELKQSITGRVRAEREAAIFEELIAPLEKKAKLTMHPENLGQVRIP